MSVRSILSTRSKALHTIIVLVLAASFSTVATADHRPNHGGGGGGGGAAYEQPVWFKWNTQVLDVFVIPPEHGQVFNGNGALGGSEGGVGEATSPCTNSYMTAILDSIAAWDAGITKFGSTGLKGVVINLYTPGCGGPTPPTSALLDPEIVITTDQSKTVVLGMAITTGSACVVDNSKFFITSFTYADMYNINAHEYGHCLGLDHSTGDSHDIMHATYSDNPGAVGNHLHCVSNINVGALEMVFGFASGDKYTSSSRSC